MKKQHCAAKMQSMVIPRQLSEQDRLDVSAFKEWNLQTPTRIEHFARRTFGWNTHSLMYSKISQLGSLGYPTQVIARVTHRKKIDFILKYTQQKLADELPRRVE